MIRKWRNQKEIATPKIEVYLYLPSTAKKKLKREKTKLTSMYLYTGQIMLGIKLLTRNFLQDFELLVK